MENEKTPREAPDTTSAPETTGEPEVEGHHMNQFAAEQEAMLRQHQLTRTGERLHHRTSNDPTSTGIVDRIRRRFER